jgi:5-deoxy-glucuronate isomerase
LSAPRTSSDPEIYPAKLPSDLAPEMLHIKPGANGEVATDPRRSGWRYLSFRSVSLGEGEEIKFHPPDHESAIVTVSGGGVEIALDHGRTLSLEGRASVFDGLPWSAYIPAGTPTRVIGRPLPGQRAVIAIAQAPLSGRPGVHTEPIVVAPADIEVEIRGAGNCTRQVNPIMPPKFPADRLLISETFTPAGNWSGWPPHKHDIDDPPREAVLEETYFFQFRRPEAWGIQRVYGRDGTRESANDLFAEVRHGDLVIVDRGYHPFIAAPGYNAYYLNALAGDRRTMANSDDPDLAWTRSLWPALGPDPRLPLVPPQGAKPTA